MDVIFDVDVDVEVTTDDERASPEADLLKNGREFVEKQRANWLASGSVDGDAQYRSRPLLPTDT